MQGCLALEVHHERDLEIGQLACVLVICRCLFSLLNDILLDYAIEALHYVQVPVSVV